MAEKKRKAAGRQKWREWAESEEHQAVLSAWARAGMTDEEIAKQIGISRSTLAEWKKKYAPINAALATGKDFADRLIENSLYKKAIGFYAREQKAFKVKTVEYDEATGSITDFDGNYTIKANKGAVITFSYIGYKTQEIKFTGQSPLNVKMIPDNQTLDEVVVVGYGTMKRSDLTGSVASIAAKDVEGFKTSSVAGALGGQIAGVQITSTDGTPGAGFSINIRGVGTLTGDSSPLYIVGLPVLPDLVVINTTPLAARAP